MPASGKKEVMSEAELQQRKIAGQGRATHGTYAFAARGEAALEIPQRSRLAELAEIIQTRPGVLALLQERCVNSVLMCERIESYIVQQKRDGKSLEDIPILGKLPAYQNSAQRCIQTLLHETHDDPGVLDAGKVLEAVRHGKED